MDLNVLTQVVSGLEPLLLALALLAFVVKKTYRRIPAFGAYLFCRFAVCAPLELLLYGARSHVVDKHFAYATYYYVYWVGYLVGASLALLAVNEIFGHLMRPFPGLGRYGMIAFRWVALISVLVSLTLAVYPVSSRNTLLIASTSGAMRCMSVLELCLLAFIVVWMQALRLSMRSLEVGVALGLGLIAAADLFGSAFAFRHSTLSPAAFSGFQLATTLGVAVWVFYFVKPSPQVTSPVRESLQRWNEIAEALGRSAPHVTFTPATNHFFLQDVEKAVDRVLEKNPGSPAS